MSTATLAGTDPLKTVSFTEVIARFIVDSAFEHPDDVWTYARRAFIDTMGCMYLGAAHPDTEAVFKTVQA